MRNRCLTILFSCLLTAGASSQQPSPAAYPLHSAVQVTAPAQSPNPAPAGTAAEKAADSVKIEAKTP